MPMGFDQFDNAARLERLGVGASLPRHQFRGPRLAEVLAGLCGDDRVANRCREVTARFTGGSGLAAAADAVESAIP
jgi:UDP:flavonoid glycosyltransferase YjiC (YdhE family)